MTDTTTDRQLRLYVGLVVSGGFCCVLWALLTLPGAPTTDRIVFLAALSVVIAAASGPIVQLRIRSEYRNFSSTSGAVLVAVATAAPSWAVLCTAVGVLASRVLAQRDRLKIAFNVAKDVIAATAAAHLAQAAGLGYGTTPSLPRLLTGLLLAVGGYAVLDELLGHTAIAVATNTTWWQSFRRNWDVTTTARVLNVAVALVTVLVIQQDRRWVVAVAPTVLAMQFATTNRIRRRTDREAWQRLAHSTDTLNVTDLAGVLAAAVTRAPALFSADEAEVELTGAEPRLARGGPGRLAYDGPPAAADTRAGSVIEAPLAGHEDTAVGVLRLRFRKPVKFDQSEQYKLQTFASALYTAVRNAGAYAELERVAAAHEHAAAHDPLTGLANRRKLLDTAAAAFTGPTAGGLTALLLIDLNHFKEVNDTLGHNAGDVVLREVARRLRAAAAAGDLVARLGGDEFAVLLTGLPTPAMAAHRAGLLIAALEPGIAVDGMQLTVEASGGIALASGAGGVTELLRRADVAMYHAKRSGQRTAVYAHTNDTADVDRLMLGSDLTRAVAEHQFAVDFQPIVDLASGEVVSAEALPRWQHPRHGELTALQFLETVERSGRLPVFVDAVLEQSLTAVSAWRTAGFDLPVAVNVSPRSLLDPDFPGLVLRRLGTHGVPPEQLVLELAETLTISQLDVVDRALRELREAGVRLALDDFGSGPASLSVLSHLRVHDVKIDRQFVRAVETSREAVAVVRSTVDLARSLRLTVVAEGVESEPQRRALWELGCVTGQGPLFARPTSGTRLLAALQRGTGGTPGTLAAPLHDAGSVVRMPRRRPAGRGPNTLPHLPA